MNARLPRRTVLTASLVAAAVGCVDLFHATDFDTLCTREPANAQCHGDAGASGDAGADAQTPRPDFCAWSTTEAAAQARRACAWLGACEKPAGSARFGECVLLAELAFDCTANPALRPRGKVDQLWACLATVRSCDDVDRCVFPGGKPPCRTIADGMFTSCAGNAGTPNEEVRVSCAAPGGGAAAGTEPCLLAGRTCVTRTASFAECARATTNAPCTESATTCVGTTVRDCAPSGGGLGAVDRGFDCAFYGGGACTTAGSAAACAPSATTPDCILNDGRVRCDGDVARVCVGGKTIEVDCAKLGLPCDVTTAAVPAHRPFDACMAWDTEGGTPTPGCSGESCSGGAIVSCKNGRPLRFDCASVGLGACRLLVDTASAVCAPPP